MSSDFDMSQYLGIFLDEAREQIQILNEDILVLEKGEEDVEVLNRMFRAAHTLKGASASMGFTKMATLTHDLENVLEGLRGGGLRLTRGMVDVFLSCLDTLQDLEEEIASGEDRGVDTSQLSDQLKGLARGEEAQEESASTPAAQAANDQVELSETEQGVVHAAYVQGYNVFHLTIDLSPDCMMKSVRAYIIFNRLKDLGEIIKSVPSVTDIEEEKFDRSFQLVYVTQETGEDIEKAVKFISEVDAVTVYQVEESINGVPVSSSSAADTPAPPVSRGEVKEAGPAAAGTVSPKAAEDKRVSQTVRVDVQRLESLMNLVGELVIERTRLAEVENAFRGCLGSHQAVETLEEISVRISRVSGELQEEIMKARMFPVDQVFNRFPRMVRDLAQKSDKDINFIMEGRETELDRTVIEEIGDPLIHLLRNSVDHGIEPPEDRRRLGKPVQGRVKLRASHQENQIVITVEDDGRGIDAEKVKNKALERGLITREAADRMSDQEARHLVFLPGFSTAAAVSDVSGRGVGMDIVRTHIERINGLIDLESRVGQGTRFTIKLPLTLAINRSLLMKLQKQIYAIPLVNVVEIISVEPEKIQMMREQEVVLLRGQVLPLFHLDRLLELEGNGRPSDRRAVVVVGISDRRAGLVVDDLLGEQEIVIKSMGEYLGRIPGLAGATIMGNGEVALILDVRGIMEQTGVE